MRLEGTGGHLVWHLGRVAQDHIQAAFEGLWDRKFDHLSGQPIPVLSHPHSKEVFPYPRLRH